MVATRWNHSIPKSNGFFGRYEEEREKTFNISCQSMDRGTLRRFQVQSTPRKSEKYYKIHTKKLIRYKKFVFKLLEENFEFSLNQSSASSAWVFPTLE